MIDVIILAGGKGTRLRNIGKNTPKPMVKFNNKPFLEYLINFYSKKKIVNKIIIATGYKSKIIEQYIKNIKSKKKIIVLNNGSVDIIKRIQSCTKIIKYDFLISYGDTFADINLNSYFNFFKKKNKNTVLYQNYFFPFGIFKFDQNGQISNYVNKPKLDLKINIGYFLIKESDKFVFSKYKTWLSFLKKNINQKRIAGKKFYGFYLSYNTPEDIELIKGKIKILERKAGSSI